MNGNLSGRMPSGLRSTFARRACLTLLTAAGIGLPVLGVSVSALAQQAETIKIAFIDPLSGLMAPVGNNGLHTWQLAAEVATREQWAKGYKFEIVPFDNKLSPQESLNNLKAAVDQGVHYIVQGDGSSVGLALEDAVSKNNERNPGKEVVYLNYAAVDPDMTNGKCNFWHFRFDANSDMKMEALTSFMKNQASIHKVYLINQDYSFGRQVRRAAREYLQTKRPDVQIVGDDLHPLAKVTDFSQYVAKMIAAGTDTVITGNWGSDLALLVKAANEAGLKANFYTYYASTEGVPTQLGAAVAGRVHVVGYGGYDDPNFAFEKYAKEFKTRYNDDLSVVAAFTAIRALSESVNKAHSAEPTKVAFALEGLKYQAGFGTVEMRATDHQLQQPIFIDVWTKADGKKVKYDQENTGYGWLNEVVLDSYVASQPTSCQLQRPAH